MLVNDEPMSLCVNGNESVAINSGYISIQIVFCGIQILLEIECSVNINAQSHARILNSYVGLFLLPGTSYVAAHTYMMMLLIIPILSGLCK